MAWAAGLWLDTKEKQLFENRCLLQSTDSFCVSCAGWRKFPRLSSWLVCTPFSRVSSQSGRRLASSTPVAGGSPPQCQSWLLRLIPTVVLHVLSLPLHLPQARQLCLAPLSTGWKKCCVCFPTQRVHRQVESRGGSVWVWRTWSLP